MAKRASSRERVERLAAEKEALEREKAEQKEKARATKKAPAHRKNVGGAPKRVKTVWKVFNASYKEVACYPYSEKAKAESHAARLTKKSGYPHFVNSAKVPMEDND